MTKEGNGLAELPKGWVWMTIGEIAQVITGTTPSKKDPSNYGDYIPFVKPPQLNDCVITGADDNLSEKGARLARILPPDSVLVSCIGILGKTGINKVPVAFNQQINAMVLPESMDPRYGFYYFQSAEIREWLNKKASATTVTIINKSKFMTAPIPIPPLAEQHRIVAKIEELFTQLDAGVAALEKAKAQLRRYRQAVLKAAVDGELTREWREAHSGELEPASVLLERILEERRAGWEAEQLEEMRAKGKVPKDDKWKTRYKKPVSSDTEGLPELPKGWCWASVEQLSAHEPNSITDGPFGSKLKTAHYTRSGPRVVRLQNVGDGKFIDAKAHISDQHFEYLRKHEVFAGDLVIAALGVDLPRACIIPDYVGPAIVKADCIRFKPHPSLADAKYLNVALNSDLLKSIAKNIVHGVGRPRLNQQQVKSLPLPLSNLAEQHLIVEEAERCLSVADEMEKAVEQSLKRAERLRQSILKRAFEGKLVPQDPSDEPASVLLEHIKAEKARREGEGKGKRQGSRRKRRQTEEAEQLRML